MFHSVQFVHFGTANKPAYYRAFFGFKFLCHSPVIVKFHSFLIQANVNLCCSQVCVSQNGSHVLYWYILTYQICCQRPPKSVRVDVIHACRNPQPAHGRFNSLFSHAPIWRFDRHEQCRIAVSSCCQCTVSDIPDRPPTDRISSLFRLFQPQSPPFAGSQ